MKPCSEASDDWGLDEFCRTHASGEEKWSLDTDAGRYGDVVISFSYTDVNVVVYM